MTPDKNNILEPSRRALLTKGVGAVAAFGILSRTGKALASIYMPTPQQMEGPFYPVHHALDEDNDLTHIEDSAGEAAGPIIYVRGRVTDDAGKPIEKALVEIWQACHTGRYNHPADDNPAPYDKRFQGWGRAVTDADGHYLFRTVLPGAYPNDPTWMRPPHIHFKVHRRGYIELTTQMYFAGNRYNEADKILRRLTPTEQARVVMKADEPSDEFESGLSAYTFDIALERA